MSAKRMKPRGLVEQEMYDARQRDLELLTSPAKSDTTIDQWSKAFVPRKKFKPLSVGRYVAKMMDLHFGLPRSSARSEWVEKMIATAIASARADERRQCLAALNDAVIKVEALPRPV